MGLGRSANEDRAGTDPGYIAEKIEGLERINSTLETNINFDSCNSCVNGWDLVLSLPSGEVYSRLFILSRGSAT